jgi:hypothetical protein
MQLSTANPRRVQASLAKLIEPNLVSDLATAMEALSDN